MKKNHLILGCSLIILLSSCAKEIDAGVEKQNFNEVIELKNDHSLTQNDALNIFEEYLNSFDSGTKSPGSHFVDLKKHSIKSTKKLSISNYLNNNTYTKSNSDSGMSEIPFYEIILENPDNTEGFAVVVGDDRFPEVIAYCPFGSLSDTVANPGLAMYFQEAIETITWELNKGNTDQEAGTKAVNHWQPESSALYERDYSTQKLWDYFYVEEDMAEDEFPWWFSINWWYSASWVDKISNAPILFRWHQYAPFNNQVPVSLNGVKAPIGCTPLAIGTVMAYHKYPSHYNWSAITSLETIPAWPSKGTAQRCVSQMLYDIGVAANTEWRFDSNGNGHGSNYGYHDTGFQDIQDALNTFGYSCEMSYNGKSINADTIKNNLERGLPVIIVSSGENNGTRIGHTWVIDGVIVMKKYSYMAESANFDWISGTREPVNLHYRWQYEAIAHQFHCVWGWTNGQGDGWYYKLTPIETAIPLTFHNYSKSLYSNINPF